MKRFVYLSLLKTHVCSRALCLALLCCPSCSAILAVEFPRDHHKGALPPMSGIHRKKAPWLEALPKALPAIGTKKKVKKVRVDGASPCLSYFPRLSKEPMAMLPNVKPKNGAPPKRAPPSWGDLPTEFAHRAPESRASGPGAFQRTAGCFCPREAPVAQLASL